MKKDVSSSPSRPNIGRVVLVTLAVLSIPLLGRMPWGPFDYFAIGTLVFGAGCALDFVIRTVEPRYRLVASLAVIGIAIMIWTELAVEAVSKAFMTLITLFS